MIILGHGIDLVEVAKVTKLVSLRSDSQLQRIFTADELAYCNKNPRRRSEHLAARFAAKEAVAKALGTGFTQGVSWFEIEIAHDTTGRPIVRLLGRTAQVAASMGIMRLHLSLSHISEAACASVVAEGESTSKSMQASGVKGARKTATKRKAAAKPPRSLADSNLKPRSRS